MQIAYVGILLFSFFSCNLIAGTVVQTGTYSDLKYNISSGDLSGTEIRIVLGSSKHIAIIQIAEGKPSDPIIAPIQETKDGKFEFQIPKGNIYESIYNFTMDKKQLAGTYKLPGGITKSFILPRAVSYWDK